MSGEPFGSAVKEMSTHEYMAWVNSPRLTREEVEAQDAFMKRANRPDMLAIAQAKHEAEMVEFKKWVYEFLRKKNR